MSGAGPARGWTMSAGAIEVEQARPADYAELMDLMVRCYRTHTPDHPRFEEFLPDLYPPGAGCTDHHLVIRLERRLVASLGLFPLELRIGPSRLRVAGIGGVSVAPEHRGKGLMTTLFAAAAVEMRGRRHAAAWLSSDRDRYARYGWEKAGSDTEVRVNVAMLEEPAAPWRVRRPDATRAPLEGILADRARLVSAGEAVPDVLRRKFLRLGMEVWEASAGPQHAYAVLNQRAKWIAEWGGAPDGLAAIFRHAIGAGDVWSARLPPVPDEFTSLFQGMAVQIGTGMDNLSVVSLPDLGRAYEPWWSRVWPAGKSLRLELDRAAGPDTAVTVADGRVVADSAHADFRLRAGPLKMAAFLFGPAKPSGLLDLPGSLSWLDSAFPLPFYMPSLWRV